MQINLAELEDLMKKTLQSRGIGDADSVFIINDYVSAELEGRRTHGIGKFLLLDHALANRTGSPEVVRRDGATVLINGNKDLGHVVARFGAKTVAELAQEHGVGVARLGNFSRFSRLGPYAELIASEGFVAIALNNAGPPAVPPYGSREPIMGTNPIAFAFPGNPSPTVIDFATSKRVWGEIRQAQLEKRLLPPHAFLDLDGQETQIPEKVNAVLPFGEYKGAALCLAVELLAGTLAGADMGLRVEDEFGLGAVFIAIRPSASIQGTVEIVDRLLDDIRASSPLVPDEPVRVPGDEFRAAELRSRGEGDLDIDDTTFTVLKRMADGGSGLEADKLTN
jgi:LDH2 family malate/lactate/ureidoglycolate dehydrogenase